MIVKQSIKKIKIGRMPYSAFDLGRSMFDVHLLNKATPDANAIPLENSR
jgi:hypothetical protein